MSKDSVQLSPWLSDLQAYVAALSSPISTELLNQGIHNMEQSGWSLTIDPGIDARDWLTAGSVEHRSQAWKNGLDSKIPLIFNARGGHGAAGLLHDLDRPSRPVWVAGSSDTTALLMWLWKTSGLGSLYAPMISGGLARDPAETTMQRLEHVVTGKGHQKLFARTGSMICAPAKSVSGIAIGGCLALLASLSGTALLPSAAGRIIFLEDVAESPFRIERYLWQLGECGWFDDALGVVLGTFPRCTPKQGSGYTLPQFFERFFAPRQIPVWWGHPFGHVEDGNPCDTIVLGGQYRLCTDDGPHLLPQ